MSEARPASRLLLVTGAMRSGTSLLQHVLCSSPDANPFVHASRYLTAQISLFAQYSGSERVYITDYLGGQDALFEFTKAIVDDLLARTARQLGTPKHLVLKNPELAYYLPHAAQLLPKARFVVSVRDPKDAIASMIGVGEKHRQRGVTSFLAGAGRDLDRLCASYRQFYAPLLQMLQRDEHGFRNRVCLVAYESLVSETEQTLERLSRFSGMPLTLAEDGPEHVWRSNVDRGTDELFSHPRWSAYVTDLSGGPISQASVGRYSDVLSKSEAARVDLVCEDLRPGIRVSIGPVTYCGESSTPSSPLLNPAANRRAASGFWLSLLSSVRQTSSSPCA